MNSEESRLKKQFESIVKEEFGDVARTSADIVREIAALNEQTYTLEKSFEGERLKIEYLKTLEEEARKKYNELNKQRRDMEYSIQDKRHGVEDNKRQVNNLNRELLRVQRLEQENLGFQEAAKNFLDGCITRPWFSSALAHQVHGAQSLAFSKRGFLGDSMGLGKTLTSLIWADMVKARKVLVLAPKETCRNFINEIRKWAPDRRLFDLVAVNKMMRDVQTQVLSTVDPEQFLIVANIETWRKDPDFIKDIINLKMDCVIIDEAHSIKNRKSIAFKGISDIVYSHNKCSGCGGDDFWEKNIINSETSGWSPEPYWECKNCSVGSFNEQDICSVKYLLAMTGTPILNRPQELWPILFLINRKEYPAEKAFLRDFCYLNEFTGRWYFKDGGISRLAKRVGKQFIMRDYSSAGVVIPEQHVHVYELDFNKETAPKQWAAYKLLAQKSWLQISDKEVIPVSFRIVLLTRFRQMATWPEGIQIKDPDTGEVVYTCPVTESIKLDRAEELAKELIASGERVILFSKFKKPLQELHKRLNEFVLEDSIQVGKRISSVILDGDTPTNIRDAVRYDFDKKTREARSGLFTWDIALCNYAVGGQSSTFTEAIHTIILDEEWNPGRRDQAYGRTHRIGQDRTSFVHLLRLKNDISGIEMIDDFMADLLNEKESTTKGFEHAAKQSTEQVLALLKKTMEM